MFTLSFLGLLALAAWLYLALAHGQFWRILLPAPSPVLTSYPSVDIIVPARNEADALPHSLPSWLSQTYAGTWRVILVDDHSTDGTSIVARKIASDLGKQDRLTIVSAPDLATGWSGKVAAMNYGTGAVAVAGRSSPAGPHSSHEFSLRPAGDEQTAEQSRPNKKSDYILFTDADIRHAPHSLSQLVAQAEDGKLDLVSRMVMLNCQSFAEKFLIPAFVFFFAMLYPFRQANNPKSRMAAAAGGTMLLRRSMLDKIGGMECIKSALIDDCSLAKAVKSAGGKIELTLTRDIESLRPYPHIADIWRMVARTAYTQLRYSPLLLAGTVIGMALLYLAPILLFLFASNLVAIIAGFTALVIMTVIYAPMVRFYGLSWLWALTLPLAALVYGMATLDSARLYHQGKGGQWKGRSQA